VKRAAAAILLVSALLTACASGPVAWPPFKRASAPSLERAEIFTEKGQYPEAVAAYDEFLAGHPNDAQVPRALANRDAIAGYVAARAEAARLRHDLTAREAEVARLREELLRIRQESERMRADLERLKQIDLRQDRRR
jgi:hypothetical protein